MWLGMPDDLVTVSRALPTTIWSTKVPGGRHPGIHRREWECRVLQVRQSEGKEKEEELVPGQWEPVKRTGARRKKLPDCQQSMNGRDSGAIRHHGCQGEKLSDGPSPVPGF